MQMSSTVARVSSVSGKKGKEREASSSKISPFPTPFLPPKEGPIHTIHSGSCQVLVYSSLPFYSGARFVERQGEQRRWR